MGETKEKKQSGKFRELADQVANKPVFQPRDPKPVAIRELGQFRIRHLQPEQRLQIKRRLEGLEIRDYAAIAVSSDRTRWALRKLLQCSMCEPKKIWLALAGDEDNGWRLIGLLTDERLAEVAREIAEFNEIFG